MNEKDYFYQNLSEWEKHGKEAAFQSNISKYYDCDAAKRILAMGEKALPYLLEASKSVNRQESILGLCLVGIVAKITGENIPKELRGKVGEMFEHAQKILEERLK